MNEQQFFRQLEQRAQEQEKLMKTLPFPHVYYSTSIWLGKHPWRILIPFSFLISFFLRLIFGEQFFDFILRIFGGP